MLFPSNLWIQRRFMLLSLTSLTSSSGGSGGSAFNRWYQSFRLKFDCVLQKITCLWNVSKMWTTHLAQWVGWALDPLRRSWWHGRRRRRNPLAQLGSAVNNTIREMLQRAYKENAQKKTVSMWQKCKPTAKIRPFLPKYTFIMSLNNN